MMELYFFDNFRSSRENLRYHRLVCSFNRHPIRTRGATKRIVIRGDKERKQTLDWTRQVLCCGRAEYWKRYRAISL